MMLILVLAVIWLWACCGFMDAVLTSEVDGEDFDWRSWDHWERVLLAPINVSGAVLSAVWEGLFGNR